MKHQILLALVILTGCSTTMGHQVSEAEIANFRPGVTHESDVIAALGEPTSSATEPDGSKIDSYTYTRMSPTFIPGQVNSTTNSHAFHFNQNGVLLDATSNAQKNNISSFGF